MTKKYISNRKYAESLLEWAYQLNPGRWVDHSKNVALAADILARELRRKGEDINPDIAYCCGILHDIGRYYGITPSVIHSYHGYLYMMNLGYEGAANICITHSFPIASERIEFSNGWDIVPEDMREFIIDKLGAIEWNIYDKIITLCDAISETDGFTLIEKRLVSVAIRNGTNENVPYHWKGFYKLKNEIEAKLENSIYMFLPEIEKCIYTPMNLENPKNN